MLRCSISGFTEPLKALRGIGLRQDYQIRASLLGPGHCCPHPFLRSWDAAGIHSDSLTWRAPSLLWLFRTRRYLHRRLNRTSHRIKLISFSNPAQHDGVEHWPNSLSTTQANFVSKKLRLPVLVLLAMKTPLECPRLEFSGFFLHGNGKGHCAPCDDSFGKAQPASTLLI